jgi:hypothetical protein
MSLLRTAGDVFRPGDPRPVRAVEQEIRDELDFHLKMRELENVRAGMPADEARRDAARRFGDFGRIYQACRRIDLGERIMLQRIQAALTVVLLAAVVFLGVGFYRAQRANEAATAQMMQTLQTLLNGAAPTVVQTTPANGAVNVDPAALTEIRVTYSRPMLDGSWSWVQMSEETYPETTGRAHYLADRKTCVLPVKLKPGKSYIISLNSENYTNFADANGRPAVPYLLQFSTRP